MSHQKKYDAIVVGAGPNGLAAAITLAKKGYTVKIIEASDEVGGGTRTASLGMDGYLHDICSAIHPMAFLSPFFKNLNWKEIGVEWANPPVAYAHPLDDGKGAAAYSSLNKTISSLPSTDKEAWLKTFRPLVRNLSRIFPQILGPLSFPKDPLPLIPFGLKAIQPASSFIRRTFSSNEVRALFAGVAAHAINPLDRLSTTAIGLVLGAAAHHVGWPIPIGGSQQITLKLASYFEKKGGVIELGTEVKELEALQHEATSILLDIGPKQFIGIAGDLLPSLYKKRLNRFEYGSGVFKIDLALSEVVQWEYEPAKNAGTVHLGGELEAIEQSEMQTYNGQVPKDPYVLVAQQSIFDSSRAPTGKHTLWAYMHAPAYSTEDLSEMILNQIERFAPGFKKTIISMHSMNSVAYEAYNPNYVGGDINAGRQNIQQLFTRPIAQIDPYKTTLKGVFLCSSSTPPGGGVHGMCGYHAAQSALKYLKTTK